MSRTPVVVDASVLLALVLSDPSASKEYARQFLYAFEKGDIQIIMTQLCQHEMAAKLISKMRGGFVTRAAVTEFLDNLAELQWTLEVDIRQVDDLFFDAEKLGCRGYDAAYLGAAIKYEAQLATLDVKLLPHVKAAKVMHWQPS